MWRVEDHTADVLILVEAPTWPALLEEAAAAFAGFVHGDARPVDAPRKMRKLTVEAPGDTRATRADEASGESPADEAPAEEVQAPAATVVDSAAEASDDPPAQEQIKTESEAEAPSPQEEAQPEEDREAEMFGSDAEPA